MNSGSLRDNKKHHRVTHDRWLALRNRATEADGYQDQWWDQQCGQCRYWLPLDASWGEDWGACSNPASDFDARVRFEHDGCEHHERTDRWITPRG